MKDRNELNQKNADQDEKELYDQLWVELEPRLKKPKRSKKLFFLLLFPLVMGSLYTISKIIDNQDGPLKTIYSTDRPDIEIQHDDIAISTHPLKQDSRNNSASSNKDKNQASVTTSNPNGNESSAAKINIRNRERLNEKRNTPLANQSKRTYTSANQTLDRKGITQKISRSNSLEDMTLKQELPIQSPLLVELDKLPIKLNLLYRRIENYTITKPMFVSEEHSSNWRTEISLSYLMPFEKSASEKSPYNTLLDESLSWQAGIGVQLSSYYRITPHIEIGMGLNYSSIWQRFNLQNEVTIEEVVINPRAFSYNGNFLSAEQCAETIISQDIVNNNKYNNLSLVPQVKTGFALNKLEFSYGIGVPISFYQSYSGTLFDETGIRTYEGALFDENRFSRVGLNLSHTISYNFGETFIVGLDMSYRYYRAGKGSGRAYNNNALNTIGLGIMVSYRIFER